MTPGELVEGRRLLEAATEGPWVYVCTDDNDDGTVYAFDGTPPFPEFPEGDVTGVSSFKDWPPGVEVVLVESANAYPDEEPR